MDNLSLINTGPHRIDMAYGLRGSSFSLYIARLQAELGKLLVVCSDKSAAEDLVADLQFISGHDSPTLWLPPWEVLPFEPLSPQIDTSSARVAALAGMLQHHRYIVVTSVDAIIQKTIPIRILKQLGIDLKIGSKIDRDTLTSHLVCSGFSRVSLVEDIGEFAVRGGVIDIFASTLNNPVRVEFLGDSIEKIKVFDPDSQRSISSIDSISILPVREIYPIFDKSPLREYLRSAIDRIKSFGEAKEVPPSEIAQITDALVEGYDYPGLEQLQPLIFGELDTVFNYLAPNTYLVLKDQIKIQQQLDKFYELVFEKESQALSEHRLIPDVDQSYLAPDTILKYFSQYNRTILDSLTENFLEDAGSSQNTYKVFSHYELTTRLQQSVGSGHALKPLKKKIDQWRNAEFHIVFAVSSESRANRLHKLLLDYRLDAPVLHLSGLEWIERKKNYPMAILIGSLSEGFEWPDEKIVFIAESEIFPERSYRRATSSRRSIKRMLSYLGQLKEGDFIVHIDFGVGIYRGLKHRTIEDVGYDFVHLEYAEGTSLYLPIQNIGKIEKFVASEGRAPSLDKLGSKRWINTKLKIRNSVISLAGDLINTYAARNQIKGWRFEPVGSEDERFADGFGFEETPDQLTAINDTLRDMASDKPMDRLVCGDVGFGKTEIALRAAFKCIQHARQTAVLVPTTILVEQHRATFAERFLGYPVKVGAISRFYPAEENKRTLEKLSSGDIDIIIGTHRLLQRDVSFKDLGLVIIDEEHRFGVKQKETLKQMRKQVDVLTLTATPIPRTLQMSLLGIRDLSIIGTPPVDRRSIRTYVSTYHESVVRDAILRELSRGGQTFLVHNEVKNIDMFTKVLADVVPEARFAYAHGQMAELRLEKIMNEFVKKNIDVLVTTTIIESGLDIPNANTIIINRADKFGLAQLYQLRGRVGRSSRQAYAYLMIPETKKLGTDAQRRLKVLQAIDDLGMGFNVAAHDLEIRGAGNLLGKDQSGSVSAVGLELYNKILHEAVLNLKGEEPDLRESIDPEVKLGISAYIPEEYIPDISERLVLYQRLATIDSPKEADDIRLEIQDRFGNTPIEVDSLVAVMNYRGLLRRFGAVKGDFDGGKLSLGFSPLAKLDLEKVKLLTKQHPNKYRFTKNLSLTITFEKDEIKGITKLYSFTEHLLERITGTTN